MTEQIERRAEVRQEPGKSASLKVAEIRLGPILRHGTIAEALAANRLKFADEEVSSLDIVDVVGGTAAQIATGNLDYLSHALTSQAYSLDATTTELMHRAWANAGDYPDAFQRYMALALKAQSNCRATLEALAKLHQPKEQIVRHVHVYEGGQAVVAEEFHHHAGGSGNAGYVHQAHATGSTIAGGAALPGPDPIGQSLPGSKGARKEPVSNARRGGRKRSAEGQ